MPATLHPAPSAAFVIAAEISSIVPSACFTTYWYTPYVSSSMARPGAAATATKASARSKEARKSFLLIFIDPFLP